MSRIVFDVPWSATDGGIPPGQCENFPVAAGSVPDKAAQLTPKALQTYSSGEIIRWIEVPVAGEPPPDFPAPVLTLTPKSATALQSSSPRSTPPSSDATADILASVALALAVASLVGVLVVARRARGMVAR